jgi:hypothetical protein
LIRAGGVDRTVTPALRPMALPGHGVAGPVKGPSQGPGFFRPSSGLKNGGGRSLEGTEHHGTLPHRDEEACGPLGPLRFCEHSEPHNGLPRSGSVFSSIGKELGWVR